jgi:hypothetical protein
MTTLVIRRDVAVQAGLGVTLATSGLLHAELYLNGYRFVPVIGPAFLVQASVFVALAFLIVLGGPKWLHWVAGPAAAASLLAFGMSRTVGIAGFVEHGWEAPYGVITVIAEVLTVALCAVGSNPLQRKEK